jgi:hypothetical protein
LYGPFCFFYNDHGPLMAESGMARMDLNIRLEEYFEEDRFDFYGLGIAPKIIDTLVNLKFENATPIQSKPYL